jgi:nicotinamidase-related amidase
MKQDALLIVDVQNDYFPGGTMELHGMDAAAANARRVLAFFRGSNTPVFHVRHLSTRPGATFFLPNTVGAEIHSSVTPENDEPVIDKYFPNAFRETPLQAKLAELDIDHLTICGAMSHMCIDTTVRAAFDLGFGCRVVSDACATRNLAFGGMVVDAEQVHAAFMAALAAVFAEVVETRSIVGRSA